MEISNKILICLLSDEKTVESEFAFEKLIVWKPRYISINSVKRHSHCILLLGAVLAMKEGF